MKTPNTITELREAIKLDPRRFVPARFEAENGRTVLAVGDRIECKVLRIPADRTTDADLFLSGSPEH